MRFIVRAVVIGIVHFLIAVAFVFAWDRANEAESQRTWAAFGSSAGTMAFSSPLYQVPAARQHLQFLVGTALNSALWGIVLAIVFSRVRRLWLLILLPILWFGALSGIATILEDRVSVTQRFQRAKMNATAVRVDQLLKALEDEDFSRIRGRMQKYLADELARGDNRLEPLPVDVQHFLVAHRFDIDALEEALLTQEPPRWEIDLTEPVRTDWLPYFSLQKLILADAFDSVCERDFDGALRRLEAAQRLTLSLRTRPEAVAVMTALASAENQLGVARKLGVALPRFDARDRLIDAFEAEAWNVRFLVATSRFDRDWNKRSAVSRALLTIFVRPFARICAADRAADERRNAKIVRDLGRCVFQPPKYPDEHQSLILNPIAAPWASTAALRAVRANRLLLDFEGTERISGAPATQPALCPDRKWVLDGQVLHLVPPLPATNGALPTRHAFSPGGPRSSSETLPATGLQHLSAN